MSPYKHFTNPALCCIIARTWFWILVPRWSVASINLVIKMKIFFPFSYRKYDLFVRLLKCQSESSCWRASLQPHHLPEEHMNGFLEHESETLPHRWWVPGSKRNKALLQSRIVWNRWQREAGGTGRQSSPKTLISLQIFTGQVWQNSSQQLSVIQAHERDFHPIEGSKMLKGGGGCLVDG